MLLVTKGDKRYSRALTLGQRRKNEKGSVSRFTLSAVCWFRRYFLLLFHWYRAPAAMSKPTTIIMKGPKSKFHPISCWVPTRMITMPMIIPNILPPLGRPKHSSRPACRGGLIRERSDTPQFEQFMAVSSLFVPHS